MYDELYEKLREVARKQTTIHYQEIAPNAQDRAEIIADDVTLRTPAGVFENCLKVEETSGLKPDEKCYKTYAPGVGLIQDEDLLLITYIKGK